MKKILFVAAFFALLFIAIIGILGEPSNEEHWTRDFFVGKAIGFCAAYIVYRILKNTAGSRSKDN